MAYNRSCGRHLDARRTWPQQRAPAEERRRAAAGRCTLGREPSRGTPPGAALAGPARRKPSMTSPSTYTARCWRDGDAWLVHVVELDEKVHVARLSQVETAARDLVARFGGENATSARVIVDLQVQDDLMHLLNAAAGDRKSV